MKTYALFQFSKQKKLAFCCNIVLFTQKVLIIIRFKENTVSCPLTEVIFEVQLFPLSFVTNLKMNFMSGNQAKSF